MVASSTAAAAAPRSRIRESFGDRVFLIIVTTALSIVLFLVLYPLIYVVSSSFSSGHAVSTGKVWLLPVDPTLDGYRTVFAYPQIMTGFQNSAIYTFFGTLVNVTLTILLGYPLSRRDFYGRNVIMMALVVTLMFYGGLIPTYLTVRSVGILNTRLAMIFPQAMAVWYVIIARTFFQSTISDELVEASEIDGCSDFRFLGAVVLPLSKPIIAVLILMYAVGHWNAYFDALIYLHDTDLFPLQIILRNVLILNDSARATIRASEEIARQGLADILKFALIVVASIPVMVLYPFAQKHFVKGVMIGSLKG